MLTANTKKKKKKEKEEIKRENEEKKENPTATSNGKTSVLFENFQKLGDNTSYSEFHIFIYEFHILMFTSFSVDVFTISLFPPVRKLILETITIIS